MYNPKPRALSVESERSAPLLHPMHVRCVAILEAPLQVDNPGTQMSLTQLVKSSGMSRMAETPSEKPRKGRVRTLEGQIIRHPPEPFFLVRTPTLNIPFRSRTLPEQIPTSSPPFSVLNALPAILLDSLLHFTRDGTHFLNLAFTKVERQFRANANDRIHESLRASYEGSRIYA
ncbi:hypothetical protein EI94DRAFT_368922 [Lactarius quietus]|nr:hypothetical protein EI94DRAFT_368922 [Lactarius quietus]